MRRAFNVALILGQISLVCADALLRALKERTLAESVRPVVRRAAAARGDTISHAEAAQADDARAEPAKPDGPLNLQMALERVASDFGCRPATTHTACSAVPRIAKHCDEAGEWAKAVACLEAVLLDGDRPPCVRRAVARTLLQSDAEATKATRGRTRALLARRAEFGDQEATELLKACNPNAAN